MSRFQQLFIVFFVVGSMATSKTVGQHPAAGHQSGARTTSLTAEQKSRVATDTLIKYFEQMIEKNILGITGLERLAESSSIINPILPEKFHTSDLVDTFKNQLDTLLEKGKDWFDLVRIKAWAQSKIQELENRERTRQHVHEETREIHVPIRFVEIPAGKYVDAITHEEFEIAPGTEIQETPVTQLQWAQVMGENPSHFIDGVDTEEVLIGGKKIKMRPDAPVENISYNQVQEFITKLNEHDKNNTNYTYALPSVQEYQALLHSVLGANWLEQIQRMKTCGDTKKTCTVTADDYITPNKQRVFGVVGNVWQWTRDMVELGKYEGRDVDAHLVFGRSYATHELAGTAINNLLMPIWYSKTTDKNIGVRPVRHAKREACEQTVITYGHDLLGWNEKDAGYDQAWHWNKKLGNLFSGADEVAWMIEYRVCYPQEVQQTIDILLRKMPAGQDPIVYLTNLTWLLLNENHIKDLTPLAKLINLTVLYLGHNQFKDLSPLANLTNLTRLILFDNQIRDLSPLAKLINLTELYLSENQFKDLSPLANLTNVVAFDLEKNQIKDLTPLANLINLAWLNLRINQINDLSPLVNLINLTELILDNNQITDLSPLTKLINLTKLVLGNNQIKNLTPLVNLTNLTELDLSGNQIEDLSPLANLTKLTELHLKNNQIKDFSPLSQLKNLRLYLDQKQLDQLGTNAKSVLPYADIRIE